MIRTGILRFSYNFIQSVKSTNQFAKFRNSFRAWHLYLGLISLKQKPRNVVLTLPVLYQISFFRRSSTPEDKIKGVITLADRYYNEMNYESAERVLKSLIEENPVDNDEILWRLARIEYEFSKIASADEKAHFLQSALQYVKKALEVNPQNGYAHKWTAIIINSTSSNKGIKERLAQAIEVRDHLLQALSYIPNDGTTHYVLGVWYYTIAELTWYERKIAQTLNSKFPTTTYQQALECFQQAESVEPDFYSCNYLYLGKCFMNLKDYDEAFKFLVKARDYPQKTEEDRCVRNEAILLLEKLGVPREKVVDVASEGSGLPVKG